MLYREDTDFPELESLLARSRIDTDSVRHFRQFLRYVHVCRDYASESLYSSSFATPALYIKLYEIIQSILKSHSSKDRHFRQEVYRDRGCERASVKKGVRRGGGFARSPSYLRESRHRQLQRPLHKSCWGVIQFTVAYGVHRTVSGIWRARREGKGGCCSTAVTAS